MKSSIFEAFNPKEAESVKSPTISLYILMELNRVFVQNITNQTYFQWKNEAQNKLQGPIRAQCVH